MSSQALALVEKEKAACLEDLKAFLRIPSVSTLPEHRVDVERAADWVAEQLRAAGMEHIEKIATAGHPLVYADWLHAPGAPTVLCYAHYDVQPPDPLDEWQTPPFEPTVRGENIYARGAADDKGQLLLQLKAAQLLMKSTGKLPVNVRFIFEGEEEVGGEAIDDFVRRHAERLQCDVGLVSDTAFFAPELPSLDIGLRGMVYTEVEVRGAASDLHSGLYGGAAPNPFEALARIIAGLKRADGVVDIPGFYDDVQAPAPEEKQSWERLPFSEQDYLKNEVKAAALTGESGYSVLERTWARPTLEVHGMPGGFTGAGAKTVIPARASAKISMRLVPNQDPGKIRDAFERRVKELTPPAFSSQVKVLSLAEAVVLDPRNRFVQAAARALSAVFDKEPVFVRSGGSIPIVALMGKQLHVPVVMMGFGLPDDGLHAPNEKFSLPNYYRGIASVMRFWENLAIPERNL